jgi:hypothetical protein
VSGTRILRFEIQSAGKKGDKQKDQRRRVGRMRTAGYHAEDGTWE